MLGKGNRRIDAQALTLTALAAVILIGLATEAVGQNLLFRNDVRSMFPSGGNDTRSVAMGDLDGDGDIDAFVGNNEFPNPSPSFGKVPLPGPVPGPAELNNLYLNDGNGVFTDATSQIPADSNYTSAFVLGDVDGDGDLDAFLGNGNWISGEQNRLYLNDGKGTFTDATSQIPADADRTRGLALGDVDGDGDLDAFVGNSGQNRLYVNDGGGVFTDATSQIPAGSDATHAVALGDVDGDGDLDAFLGNGGSSYAEQNRLYLNDGTGVFSDATSQIPLDSDSTHAIALGDVDGDGDLDAFVGNSGQNRLYVNDGNGVFTDATSQIPTDEDFTFAVALGDVDGDGDLDAFLGGYSTNSTNRLYVNDGNGVFTDATSQIPGNSDETYAVALGDVDGDGDLDAFLGNCDCGWGYPYQNRLYLNDGNGIFSDATAQIPVGLDSTGAVALGDVDGDGDLDAFIGNHWDQNRLYLNDGSGVFTDATSQIPEGGWTTAIALGDVDGDGDLDVFLGGDPNRLYLNGGNGVFTDATSQIPTDSDYTLAVALADVDGDGDLDAFIGNDGQNRLYLNNGSGVFADATSQLPAFKNRTHAVALGDLDDDADLDAFVGMVNQSYIYTNLTRQLAWRGVPRIGKRLDVDLYGPADGTYVLGISRRETYRPKPPRGVLKIHPGYVLHTAEGSLDSDGHALLTYNLPDDPSLVGKSFYWQALVKSPGRFTNLEVTTLTDL